MNRFPVDKTDEIMIPIDRENGEKLGVDMRFPKDITPEEWNIVIERASKRIGNLQE